MGRAHLPRWERGLGKGVGVQVGGLGRGGVRWVGAGVGRWEWRGVRWEGDRWELVGWEGGVGGSW